MKYLTSYLPIVILLTSCYTKEQRMRKQKETFVRRMKEAREIDSLRKLKISNDSLLNFVRDDNGNYVEKKKIDSLIWILYAANFQKEALHGEDRKMPKLYPVQCNFLFRDVTILGKDTIQYFFSFYYKNPEIYYQIDPDDAFGVVTIQNVNRYLVGGHLQMDKPATPKLSQQFFIKRDTLFRNYLKTYNGELSDWLRNEAVKRGVLIK